MLSSSNSSLFLNALDAQFDTLSKIEYYLFVTSIEGAENIQQLQEENIGFMVNVADINHSPSVLQKYKALNIEYLWRPMQDDEKEDLLKFARPIHRRIQKYRRHNPEKTILIHCRAGASRSVAIVMYHLIRNWHMSYTQALTLIEAARPIIDPNDGFRTTLKVIGAKLISSKLINDSGKCQNNRENKQLEDLKPEG